MKNQRIKINLSIDDTILFYTDPEDDLYEIGDALQRLKVIVEQLIVKNEKQINVSNNH